MRRPVLLDLFCGAGGAAMGYQQAGFDVVGVDIKRQPNYPFRFIDADAMSLLRAWGSYVRVDFAAIHASPPCQDHSPLSALVGKHGTGHLLPDTRAALEGLGLPYVIENVKTADMRPDAELCGKMFGLRVKRHRLFEIAGFKVEQPPHPKHTVPTATSRRRERWEQGWDISITGDVGTYMAAEAMGIDWMTGNELSQAIPPAYTRFIGEQLLAHLSSAVTP